jgi:histidinol-phosphate aminotransferase
VIVDEAYCEFNLLEDPDASLELLAHHPNLVLLRTFSKVYGLCGLRVGYALCGSSQLPRAVDQVRQPFFCNALAQAAGLEALSHQDAVADRVTRTIAERISVHERLLALGLQPADSQANFCWFGLDGAPGAGSRPDAQELQHASQIESETMWGLADRGVLVRGGGALGRPGWLRVTYGTDQENARFLDALGEVQAQVRAAR